jgi:hypothetical protein
MNRMRFTVPSGLEGTQMLLIRPGREGSHDEQRKCALLSTVPCMKIVDSAAVAAISSSLDEVPSFQLHTPSRKEDLHSRFILKKRSPLGKLHSCSFPVHSRLLTRASKITTSDAEHHNATVCLVVLTYQPQQCGTTTPWSLSENV